ncbi:MAG: signal recognition particle protein [Rhodospirillaceae bacterium]|jgi:signal recognition particle subunit SRP54|nr:signal recognition particle protein [Rhodospirillaceae bacterium]
MLENLSSGISSILERLKRHSVLSEAEISDTMNEIRIVLLESDVALSVVTDFIKTVKKRAIGQEVVRSVTPSQMIIKIVHDSIIDILGTAEELNLATKSPIPILIVGIQGSGKTTTSAKMALRLKKINKKKVLLASLDIYRPAAQQQLEVLAHQAEISSLSILMNERPLTIAKRALTIGRDEGYDVVILDTAGRLHIDDVLMSEVKEIFDEVNPTETLLVVDAMTGQDAVNLAKEFNEQVNITGLVLTRVDGDARGGAALSMRSVTGRPIKFLGTGEKLDALEVFHPDRIVSRILGMGDIISLVEKATENFEKDEIEKLSAKVASDKFDLDDLATQFRQIKKIGDLDNIINMLPGINKIRKQIDFKVDSKTIDRQEAIILSMTKNERKNPDIIMASRKRRIATGAGVSVHDVDKLLKQFKQMVFTMKKIKKNDNLSSLLGF